MKNAIITGSSRGLGKAIAHHLSQKGFRVWLSARNLSGLNATKVEIEHATGNPVMMHEVDFANSNAVGAYAALLSKELESVDVLVNNAGIYVPDKLTDGSLKLDLQMQVNFNAAVTITQALSSKMMQQGTGHIFNICSVVNRKPRIEAASYTISKSALFSYHQLLKVALKEYGVKVTAFLPASINTSSWDGMDAPKNAFIQPEDVAQLVGTVLDMKAGTAPTEIDIETMTEGY